MQCEWYWKRSCCIFSCRIWVQMLHWHCLATSNSIEDVYNILPIDKTVSIVCKKTGKQKSSWFEQDVPWLSDSCCHLRKLSLLLSPYDLIIFSMVMDQDAKNHTRSAQEAHKKHTRDTQEQTHKIFRSITQELHKRYTRNTQETHTRTPPHKHTHTHKHNKGIHWVQLRSSCTVNVHVNTQGYIR
jgi:hypothetical protein